MTHEQGPGAETPPRPEQAPGPSPPAGGDEHWSEARYEWLKITPLRFEHLQLHEEGLEAGYRLAISDLEAWIEWNQDRLDPELIPGITRAIDKLSIRADDFWPPEENT